MAIRLRDVGLFDRPVALEGLSGRLDVLVGSNESGKSTLFGALSALFKRKHTSAAFEDLKPYRGGDPYVEAELEIGGRRWRLAKQFGRGRSAVLEDLSTGRIVAKNSDVDARLPELCGLQAWGAIDLLWVAQKDSLEPFQPDREQTTLLTEAIAREVSAAVGGPVAHDMRQRVKKDLDVLMTEKRTGPRAGGPLFAALGARQKLQTELDRARQRAARAASAATSLDEYRRRQSALSEGGQPASLDQASAVAASQGAEGVRAQDRMKAAASDVQARRLVFEKASGALSGFENAVAEAETIQSELTVVEADHALLQKAVAELEAAVTEIGIGIAPIEEELAEVRAAMSVAERAESVRLARRRLDDLHRLHGDVTEAIGEIAGVERCLTGNRVTEQSLMRLEVEEQEIRILRGRLDATAPRIDIAYDASGSQCISLDGVPLGDGTQLRPHRPITLNILGVGAITISPTSTEHDTDDLAAHEGVRRQLLEAMSVADADAARVGLTKRRRSEARLLALKERLRALAPHGLGQIEARMAQEKLFIGGATETLIEISDISELRSRQRSLEAEVVKRRQQLDLRRREHSAKASIAAKVAAREEMGRVRLAELLDKLPPPEERQVIRADLISTRRDASQALDRALTDHAAIAEAAPSVAMLESWRREETEARRIRAAWDRERLAVATEIANLEGQLGGNDGEDVSRELRERELEGELERVGSEIAHYERQVKILTLIDDALNAADLAVREQLVAPVIKRLQPYIDDVLPGAQIHHGDGFAPTEIARGGTVEPFVKLSHGTQEQIGILARLGMARLLADSDAALPLVLDDALVYSDDERVAAMLRALERAAGHHQVIVLTCRSQAFTGASATRLAIGPWVNA
jgi:energy-coupling factor transporter ATP-binding protein EcfA2